MEKIHVKDVIAILIEDSTIIKDRQKLWVELGISQADYDQLNNRYTMGAITANDFFFDMVSRWISAQEKPLLTTFLDALKKCGFVNAASKNNTAF